MKPLLSFPLLQSRRMRVASIGAAAMLAVGAAVVVAQTSSSHPASSPAQATAQQQDLLKQLEELRAQVVRLQSALDQQKQTTPTMPGQSTGSPMSGEMAGMPVSEMGKPTADMGMTGQMSGMPPMGGAGKPMGEKGMMGEMGGMSGGMNMHKGEMGMPMPSGGNATTSSAPSSGMTAMPGMSGGAAAPPASAPKSMSSLPGIPGTSHLYHVGSTDFFLDQPTLALTAGQKASLNAIKEGALLDRAKAERAIARAEEELWTLTGADQPDSTRIQSKLQEVEKLRTTQRLAFIRAVGDATTVLTTEQQAAVLGIVPSK